MSISIFSVLYFFIIEIILHTYIIKYWSYVGFSKQFSALEFLISALGIFLISSLMQKRINSIRSLASVLLFLSFVVPTISLNYFFSPISILVVMVYLISVLFSYLPKINISKIFNFSERFIITILFIFVVSVMSYIVLVNGFSSFNLNILDVYDFRATQKTNINPYILMFNSWLSKIMLPILLVYAVYKKNIFLQSFVISIIFICFAFVNVKAAIIYPLISVFFYFLISRNNNSLKLIQYTIFFVSFIMIIDYIFNISYLSAFLIRRTLFTPALLLNQYYDYFLFTEPIYWGFSQSGIELTESSKIGELVASYNGRDSNASTGFIASGLSQGWIFGSFLYAILFFLTLYFLDCFEGNKVSSFFAASSVPILLHIILNGDLFTSYTYHGFLVLIMIIFK